jgi:hypothetical protein
VRLGAPFFDPSTVRLGAPFFDPCATRLPIDASHRFIGFDLG